MITRNKTIFTAGILAALVLGTMATGVAGRVAAQELVKATFTLTEETRFGATVLSAGQYTLLVEPITPMRAVGSPVAITVRAENRSRAFVSVLATASQEGCSRDELKLSSNGTGHFAQSMCLEKQQLMLRFDGSRSGKLL
jgi:hypothetical protein